MYISKSEKERNNMKKCLALLLTLVCLVTLVACNSNSDDQSQNNAKPAYFVGKVTEIYDNACLVEVTDGGNYGKLAVGTAVQVTTNIENCPDYAIGDYLRVEFDGTMAETYPLQVLHVLAIDKTDSTGNSIE